MTILVFGSHIRLAFPVGKLTNSSLNKIKTNQVIRTPGELLKRLPDGGLVVRVEAPG